MLYCYYWSILIANSSNLTCKIAKHMLCVKKYLQYEFCLLILFSVIFISLSFCYIFILQLRQLTKLYKHCCGSASWLLLPSIKWISPHTLFAVLRYESWFGDILWHKINLWIKVILSLSRESHFFCKFELWTSLFNNFYFAFTSEGVLRYISCFKLKWTFL